MAFAKAIRVLIEAAKNRQAVGPISDLVPGGLSLEDAHTICETIIQRRIEAGDEHIGYKVGFTNISVREQMGLPDSTYGYELKSMVFENGGELSMSALIAPKIECEICVRLGQDLNGKSLTVAQVMGAIEAVGASFEICDARIQGWKCPYPDFFADNGFAAGIVLSGRWVPVGEVNLLEETVVLTQDGAKLAEGRGAMAMGHPANVVAWLAGKLADRGKGLKAGQLVMTGTLTPIFPIEQGSTYVASFSTLGEVRKTFV